MATEITPRTEMESCFRCLRPLSVSGASGGGIGANGGGEWGLWIDCQNFEVSPFHFIAMSESSE